MKEFIVTEEILELFKGKKVTNANVVKAVPNYMDYALDLTERRVQYSPTATNIAETFGYFIGNTNFMTKREFLTSINNIFKNLNDDVQFCFNGEYLIDGGNYYINVFEEVIVKENEYLVIEKITDKIRKAIKENKNKERTISDDILQSIALNPELMKKLKEIQKEQNEIKR